MKPKMRQGVGVFIDIPCDDVEVIFRRVFVVRGWVIPRRGVCVEARLIPPKGKAVEGKPMGSSKGHDWTFVFRAPPEGQDVTLFVKATHETTGKFGTDRRKIRLVPLEPDARSRAVVPLNVIDVTIVNPNNLPEPVQVPGGGTFPTDGTILPPNADRVWAYVMDGETQIPETPPEVVPTGGNWNLTIAGVPVGRTCVLTVEGQVGVRTGGTPKEIICGSWSGDGDQPAGAGARRKTKKAVKARRK